MCRTCGSSSIRCWPLACAAVRDRLMLQTVFSLPITEVTAPGPHVSTTISQRVSSSWTEGENPTSYGFSPEVVCSRGFPGGSDSEESTCNAVQSLDQEDPLEKGMATSSSILAWRIPWTEETGNTPTARETALWKPVLSVIPGQAGVFGGPRSPCHASPSPCSACGFLRRVHIVITSFSCR